jgi:hypothetical protein
MTEFITPPEYSGVAALTASTGLVVVDAGEWQFSQAGYNDGVTFGLSLSWPNSAYNGQFSYGAPPPPGQPISGGRLKLQAQAWSIPGGSELTEYTDPTTGDYYSADQCQITITGAWSVARQVNSNSFNSFGVELAGSTDTDLGARDMDPWLLSYDSPRATYIIQGAEVADGAQDTFSDHLFYCEITESARTDNSNYMFQSNTIATPVWIYQYQRRWQISSQIDSLQLRVAQFRHTRS